MTRAPLLLVPVLLLPSCGSGDDEKARFVARAEAVCATAKAERDKNPQPSTVTALAGYVDTLVRIADTAHRDLSALELPEDDAADLRSKLLEPLGADVAAGRAFGARVRAAGTDGGALLALLQSRPRPTVDLDYARSYGLPTCAQAAQ